ncbi:MAG: dockerin type I domain-containing protein, partial [Phycisphaerae bacterium]
DTTIRLGTYDWDGREAAPSLMVLEAGADFTIEADAVDRSAGDGYDGTVTVGGGALLTVNTPHPWRLDGGMHLAGGRVGGSEIQVYGVLSGSGRVDADGLDNCGEVAAAGGKLSLETASFPDLDGSTGHGTVSALDGDVEVRTDPGGLFTFRGRLNIGGGHTFAMRDDGLANEGLMDLTEGEYVAPRLEHRRIMTVGEGTSRLVTGAVFAAGSETTIEGELAIAGSGEVEAGASITGAGMLAVEPAARLWAEGAIDVDVLNAGWLAPGTSAGTRALSGDYRQEGTGTLQVELEGTGPGEIDLLAVGGSASLDGVLELDPGPGFDPDYGDKFAILTAERLSGRFDLITGFDLSSDMWLAVLYTEEMVAVAAVLPGDTNMDGKVNYLDYLTLKSNLDAPTQKGWPDGDFDGDSFVGSSDFHIMETYFGASIKAPGQVVPEPATALLLGLAGLALLRRRHS